MSARGREDLLENLAAAAALGFLALLVAAASLAVDSAATAREGAVLASLAGVKSPERAIRDYDPGCERLFLLKTKRGERWGAVARLGAPRGTALVAFLFGPEGELEAYRLLGGSGPSGPWERDAFLAPFLGKGGAKPFPSRPREVARPDAIAGATESFLSGSLLLTRLSDSVRAAAAAERR